MVVRIHGNRPIKTLAGQSTRPTSSRVREALFNIWQGRIEGCQWLDLCAGSGAMGAEALSRGAATVVGIEKMPKACSIIQENWTKIARPEQSIRVIRGDVRQKLDSLAGMSFDCMYFDPPYASGVYLPVLQLILDKRLLSENGEIAVEHDRNAPLPDTISLHEGAASPILEAFAEPQEQQTLGLTCCRRKSYGRTSLTFYRYSSQTPS
jgi:16S rRNA (guanine(966)-N(2))-methyltransferase RsmD